MDQPIVVFVSVSNEGESLKIARTIVQEKLAACANLFPRIRSIYRWEGKICDEPEWYLIIKTRRALFPLLQERIKALHSYEVPEIIALAIVEGLPSYLDWIGKETEQA
jgi:periplasmic divalent cation tolerance protein